MEKFGAAERADQVQTTVEALQPFILSQEITPEQRIDVLLDVIDLLGEKGDICAQQVRAIQRTIREICSE